MTRRLINAAGFVVVILLVGTLAYVVYGQGVDTPARTTVPDAQSNLADEVPMVAAPQSLYHGKSLKPITAKPVKTGKALVTMRVPRFGRDWKWTALEGTAEVVIADGPGHYSETVLPGQQGNTAFAAHRAGHGDPFIDFDRLEVGDKIIFEQGKAEWVYRIDTAPRIIDVDDTWVLDPLPGYRMTLTTCWPKYGSSRRMYVRGTLVRG